MTAELPGAEVRRPSSRRARWARISMYCLFAIVMISAMVRPTMAVGMLANGLGLFGLLALVFGVASATRRRLPGRIRVTWWLLSSGFLILNLVPIAVAASNAGRPGRETGISLDPSAADLLRLIAVLPMLAALVCYPRRHSTRQDTRKLLIDIVTVVGGSFMLMWFLVLGPVLTSHLPALTMVVAALYPIGDLAVLFGGAVVVLRGAHAGGQRPMTILLAGLVMLVATDTYLGYIKLHPAETHHSVLQMVALTTSLFLIALAGLEQCLPAPAEGAGGPRRRPLHRDGRLPYVALAAGCGLLVVEALHSGLYPWGGLTIGAVVMIASTALRQFIAIRENQALILRDSLTGLANRVRLHDVLDVAVDHSNRTGRRAAVMVIDLDGFKLINDALGHHAGDQLLIGFAALLKANVLGADTVARLGGDEFAVVLHHVGAADHAEAVANRVIDGMRTPIAIDGEPVHAVASIGIAVTVPGRPTVAAELLHQADMAMYRAKREPGSSAHLHASSVTPATAPASSRTAGSRTSGPGQGESGTAIQ